jgi:hypothetical protein
MNVYSVFTKTDHKKTWKIVRDDLDNPIDYETVNAATGKARYILSTTNVYAVQIIRSEET